MPRTADGSAGLATTGNLPPPRADFRQPARLVAGATLGLLALGVVWRVARFAACPPLWGDEAFIAVNLLARDYAGMLRTLEYYQIVPLGFLWAELAVVRAFGGSEWAVRLIPFCAGLLALGLFGRFASRVVDRRAALLAIGIFAASFYPVRHATEVKPYATDLLIALAATVLAWSLRRDPSRLRRWAALTAVIGLGVWFSYPLIFVAASVGLFLVGRVIRDPRPRAIAGLVAFATLSAASWLASYLAFGRPQALAAPFYSRLETWRGAFPPLARPWEVPAWLLDVHTGNMLAYPLGGNNYASSVTTILVTLGAVRLWRSRRDLVVLLLGPLPFMLLASCFRLYPYGTSARTTLFLAPAFCLLAGVGAMGLFRRFPLAQDRRRCLRLAVLGLGAIPAVAAVANVAQPYKNWEDLMNRRAVEALAALAGPGDRWLVTDGLDARLESRHAILEHWVQQVAEVRYNILADAPVPTKWLPNATEVAAASRSGQAWLIVHRTAAPRFDEDRILATRRQLEASLGTPRVHRYPLTRGESITAYQFEGPSSARHANPVPAGSTGGESPPAAPPGVGGPWALRYNGSSRPALP